MGIGLSELILILVVILLFVGPKKLPEAGAALGKALREFKSAFNGKTDDAEKKQEQAADSGKKD